MTRSEISERLTTVFRSVFDDPTLVICDEMTAKDVEHWDSVSHIDMICMVEDTFKLKFTTRQVAMLKSVGELITLIENSAA